MIFLSVVMAYYENPKMLRRQLENFASLPEDLLARLEYIVVDDGSPTSPAADVAAANPWPFKFQLYRVKVDVRWNQDSARNIGAHHSSYPWLLLTDIDHLVPEETLQSIVFEEKLFEGGAYRFSRKDDVSFEPYKPHPNSWLMTRATFDATGGYDERFAGWYGTDGDFRNRVMAKTQFVRQLRQHLIRVGREHTPDASCPREFGRKNELDSRKVAEIKAARALEPGWQPRFLSFPYEKQL